MQVLADTSLVDEGDLTGRQAIFASALGNVSEFLSVLLRLWQKENKCMLQLILKKHQRQQKVFKPLINLAANSAQIFITETLIPSVMWCVLIL